jgi:histidinol-phosphatase
MFEAELDFARELADRAGDITMSYFQQDMEVRQKADQTPVTKADLRVEAMIRLEVARRFPGDGVLGEEEGGVGGGDRLWIVDPIDGTKNYVAGIQVWGTLIAFAREAHPVVGVIDCPAIGERYEAVRGEGARMNGAPIRVSSVRAVSEALVLTGSVRAWTASPYKASFIELFDRARQDRGFGDAWGHLLVARGAADVMVDPMPRVWDTTAVQVVVEEAGGRMSALDAGPLRDGEAVLTTNGLLHDEVLSIFASQGP